MRASVEWWYKYTTHRDGRAEIGVQRFVGHIFTMFVRADNCSDGTELANEILISSGA